MVALLNYVEKRRCTIAGITVHCSITKAMQYALLILPWDEGNGAWRKGDGNWEEATDPILIWFKNISSHQP